MTSVSQIIPNFVQGINEQPDELKKPGQVRDAVNCIPDVTKGLIKRPGYELLAEIPDLIDGTGTWFDMYREDDSGVQSRYIVHVHSLGKVTVLNADTGFEVPVWEYDGPLKLDDYSHDKVCNLHTSLPYLQNDISSSALKLKHVTINDTTFIVNPSVQVGTSSSKEAYRPYQAFIELTVFDPNRSYTFDVDMINTDRTGIYNRITGVELISSAGLRGNNNRLDGCPLANRWRQATDKKLGAPNEDGNRLISGTASAPVEMEIEVTALPSTGNEDEGQNPQQIYCNYRVLDSRLLNGGLGWNVDDVFTLQFRGNQLGNLEGDENDPQDFAFTFRVKEVVTVSQTIDFQISAGDTSSDSSVGAVLGKLQTAFTNTAVDQNGDCVFHTVDIVGNGIYLESSDPFLVETSEKDLSNLLVAQAKPDEFISLPDPNNPDNSIDSPNPIMVVNNASNLPLECKFGVVVKVENSFSADDDYFVKFVNDYDLDSSRTGASSTTVSGLGYWKEIAKPLESTVLNPVTMPHVLVHDFDSNGNELFVISEVSYDERHCGDADRFNPSFVGNTITNLSFFRNRIIAFSEENIISTAAGDYDNWFPSTALTTSPSDPIDISASTTYSSVLRTGIPVNNAMVVFASNQQFILTTDSDVFDSRTAKVSQISAYPFNIDTDAINLGTNIAFIGGSDKDSKFLEMSNIFREGQVDINERSKVISEAFSGGYELISSSMETDTIMFGNYGSKNLLVYRYFKEGSQKDVQNAWTKFTLPDPLVFHFSSQGQHFVVVENNNKFFLMRADPNREVYLDAWIGPGLNLGYEYKNYTESFFNFNEIQVRGGEPYEMSVELPHFYLLKKEQTAFVSDTTASLTIHRMKLNTGTTNVYDVEIERYGKDNYSVMYEQTMQDVYEAGNDPTRIDTEQTIPLYERNTNLNITIKSEYPAPTTLYSLRWEGDYSNRYYQRV